MASSTPTSTHETGSAQAFIDAAREARKGDDDARLWLETRGVDLLVALIPASVEPEFVIARLLAGQVPRC